MKDNLYSEIRILKGLYHPHIVALIDCHETTSHIHLVMEYCALGDLSMFIKRRESLGSHRYTREMMAKYPNPRKGALNEVIVRHFLKQLSSALKFLRASNLIHRDIKPQNLLLCPAPSSYRSGVAQVIPFKGSEDSFSPTTGLESLPMLKIADFGFARSLPATSLAETLCGSPLYMAPEILRYEKYDAKADLWSVGTVLYEMIVGKPPFRASNHVELLRKIERGDDRIKFPEDNPASEDLKKLIRLLLKRNPVERMTFPDFFENNIIVDEIPGLIREDQQPSASSSQLESRSGSATPTETRQPTRQEEPLPPAPPAPAPPTTTTTEKAVVRRPSLTARQMSGTPPPDAMPMRRVGSADRPPSAAVARESPRAASPPIRYPTRTNFTPAPPTAPNPDRQRERIIERPEPRHRPSTEDKSNSNNTRDERERAAQEVAFERDYVVVEKRAVEVNAFADEMAHSPRIHGGYARPGQGGTIARRTTIANVPTTNAQTASPSSSPSPQTQQPDKAMQIVTSGRQRADSSHSRQSSYERRYGQSPTSATSAISKALNMASGRLFGMGFSPPPMTIAKGGRSPPLAYNPFPAYPTPYPAPGPQGGLIAGDGARTHMAVDEDSKTVQVIEECATRSDVVYGFAEVKYKQLIPLAPSAQSFQQMKPSSDEQDMDTGDTGLTVDAIVTLSEEALVLYVKALSLLAKTMDIAGAWWTRKNRGEPFEPSVVRGDPPSAVVGTRVNNVVQWVRGRFNEVLEKAELVRLKLLEGQKRLGQPGGHQSVASSAGSVDVVVSSGVTAEKLMYDRALEMSRTAAINELTSEDLQGCEIAYVTAIRMLEAVLEDDELSRPDGKDDKIMLDDRHVEDRQIVLKCEFFLFFFFPWYLEFKDDG